MGNKDFGGWKNLKFLSGHRTFEMHIRHLNGNNQEADNWMEESEFNEEIRTGDINVRVISI